MIDHLNTILFFVLIVLVIFEVRQYNEYTQAQKHMSLLGQAIEASFNAVKTDVIGVNDQLISLGLRVDYIDNATDILNKNDKLIQLYLELFRDALTINPKLYSEAGTFGDLEAKS